MDAFTAELNELFVTTYHSICKVEEAMLRSLSNSKLTIAEMHMLEAIGKRRSQGRTITDLAQDQEISLPSVTMTIKRLEKKGYVCKDKSAEDGRCVRVKLTREGERAEIAHRYFHRQMVRAVAGAMDEAEKAALLNGLHKLNGFLRHKVEEMERTGGEGD